jgi:hypothetical protein
MHRAVNVAQLGRLWHGQPANVSCVPAELIGSTSVAVESILRLQIFATHFGPPRDRPCRRAIRPTATSTVAIRYVRLTCAPCQGGAFPWVQAPPGNRSSRKHRIRLIAGQVPVHAQERRFDRPVAAHDHGSGFVRNGNPAPRTDAKTEHGAASNLLMSFRDQAALHGQLEVETLDVIKPDDDGSEAASRRTALRRHVCRRRR